MSCDSNIIMHFKHFLKMMNKIWNIIEIAMNKKVMKSNKLSLYELEKNIEHDMEIQNELQKLLKLFIQKLRRLFK